MSGGTAKRSPIPSRGAVPGSSPLLFALVVAMMPVALPASAIAPAASAPDPAEAVKAPEEFAGVYLDRYVAPKPALEPAPAARSRARALSSYYLGLLKEAAGDGRGAVLYYREVLSEDPSSIELAGRAARISAQDGDVESGLGILRETLEKNPGVPDCYLLLSSYYATFVDDGTGKEEPEAVRVARDARARFPDNPRVIEHLVLTLLGFNDKEAAESVLKQALEREDPDPLYWFRLGKVAQNVWPIPEAPDAPPERVNAIYEKALRLAGSDSRLVELIADFFFASDQHGRAAELYKGLIEREPGCVTPREKLGRIHALTGDFDSAIRVLSELLETHPDRPDTQQLLARIYEEEKEDYEKAVEHYQNALRLSMGEVQDYLHTAALMLTIPKRAGDSVDLLERARFHFPDNGTVLRLLGIAHYFNEDYSTAVKTFEETVGIAADPAAVFIDDELYFRFGAAHERLKNYDQAAELFRKAISLVPAEEPARAARIYNYLGYMWLEQDMNIEEAGELIIKANELIPDDGAFVDSLGWFHFKQKEYDKALSALLRAEELLGEDLLDAVVVDHIAQSYFHLGKIVEAIAYEERAVKLDPESEEYPRRLEFYRKSGAGSGEKPAAGAAPSAKPRAPGEPAAAPAAPRKA